MDRSHLDAVVVGAGPNGLTAAVVLASAGLSVAIFEEQQQIGGGCRTEALTLPGFAHDVCSAIHPMGVVSPAFRAMDLSREGLEWVPAGLPLAHPLGDGRVALLSRNIAETAAALGRDGAAWERLFRPFLDRHQILLDEILKPVRLPHHPWLMARFGRLALRSCDSLVRRFDDSAARTLFAGCAAHSFLPLDAAGSSAFGLVLALAAHAVDWPSARGGSQRIADALASRARRLGATIQCSAPIRSLRDLPPARAVLLDVTPRQLDTIAGDHLSAAYRRRLAAFRYGAAAFKIDYALSEPIPWRSPECSLAATVHLGGSYDEIAGSEAAANAGRVADAPFVLVAQQSRFDGTRAPAGRHTGWAYCHVPNGFDGDITDRIEQQIERFAPGFRDVVLEKHVMAPRALEAHNANLVGGDIGGGANTLAQFLARPSLRWNPYTTSNPKLFLCSSSTPPGGGVHGMCGYWAARAALRNAFGIRHPPSLAPRHE